MKKKVIRNFFVVVLVFIIITSIFLMYKNSNNKKTVLDNVKLNEIDKYSGIALMLQQADGTYQESTSSEWPTSGYMLNQTKSGCIDVNANPIEKALSYQNGTLKIKTRTNASCYLYFDIPDLQSICKNYDDIDKCSNSEDLGAINGMWDSTLEGDGYRYVGTNPDNYICFGTTNQSECKNNPDKYMYRIIGIFESDYGTQHLKLIKKEALNTTYAWNADFENDVSWENSDIYKGINGSYFLNNTTYSYMQDTNWTNKIETWDYTATNTLTWENDGMDYYSSVVKQTYLHEMNRSTKRIPFGEWKTVNSKIGLMYVSDYQLSLGSTALDYTNSNSKHYKSMKTGWMHITNNDSGAPSQYEWTMSRYGNYDGNGYYAWGVYADGFVDNPYVDGDYLSVRPVFYLTSDVTISGVGTIENPYIIS